MTSDLLHVNLLLMRLKMETLVVKTIEVCPFLPEYCPLQTSLPLSYLVRTARGGRLRSVHVALCAYLGAPRPHAQGLGEGEERLGG